MLADAERTAFDRQIKASRLRLAGEVRGAWWAVHRARIEKELAAVQLAHARQIAADVSRRVKAGDLARADQHQADGAVAAAQVALAQTEVAFGLALESLRALVGRPILPDAASAVSESLPDVPADFFAAHTDVEAVASRAQVAAQSAQLAAVRTRANPELFLASGKDRSAAGETWSHKMVIGVRLPFGGPKQDAALAHAKADAAETEAHVALKRAQLQAEWDSARAKVSGMREALAASEARATLARESRRLFEKSFALGQTDLPTRLRIETEAIEAERQVVRSRMDLAAAISALRQAAGLLPE